MLLVPQPAVVHAGGRQREGLNNKYLELELEINSDWRLSNHDLMKKSDSLGGCSPGNPFGSTPANQ